jgi:N-acetylneuraminic acid mutarotase
MPTARFDLGLAAASNGKLYAVGGMDDKVPQSNPSGNPGNVLTTVEEYDPVTDTWASKKPIPTARILQGLASAGRLYAIGGAIAVGPPGSAEVQTVGTVEAYDPETDTWTTKKPMPTARDAPAAVASNGRLYIVGGVVLSPTSFEITAAVEEYDPATDIWVTKRPFPTAARGDLGLAAASNGKLYAIGGIVRDTRAVSGFSTVGTVEEYDPATDTWTTKKPMPTARSNLGLVAASDGKLYAVGGHAGRPGDDRLATVEAYDPTTDSWATVSRLPTPRANLGVAAASNGKLYAIGGGDASNALATVEEYTP